MILSKEKEKRTRKGAVLPVRSTMIGFWRVK
jgi:hypothetical protein